MIPPWRIIITFVDAYKQADFKPLLQSLRPSVTRPVCLLPPSYRFTADNALLRSENVLRGWLARTGLNCFLIKPCSVNTCRILTLILPDHTITIPFAVMRFGRKGSTVDSWSKGGIAFAIDLETGKVGKGLFHPDYGSTKEVTHHPDSGVQLSGLTIPYWKEIKEMVLNAAMVTPGIKSVGWDVAVTQRGPLLIEGNSLWNPLIFQAIYGGFLSSKNRAVLARAGVTIR